MLSIKNKLRRFKEYTLYKNIASKHAQLEQKPLIQLIVYAASLTFILEFLSHRSILKGFLMMFKNPIMFFSNTLIILITFSLASFFKRKSFAFLIVTVFWLTLGSINFFLLGFRTTPFSSIDLHIIASVIEIIDIYLTPVQFILFGLLIVSVLIFMGFAFTKFPKTQVYYKNSALIFSFSLIILFLSLQFAHRSNALSRNYTNLGEAYRLYGFSYCFTNSFIDRGIKEPETYSQETMETVLQTIENEVPDLSSDMDVLPIETSEEEEIIVEIEPIETAPFTFGSDGLATPNIIFLQLESFFDVNYLINYSFSTDPTPNFNALKQTYSSGFLEVPTIGAGTVNTEFEVLTGMSLSFFGAGEYPYKTVLTTDTIESISFVLNDLGYHSHAIHNNTGSFYNRHLIYPNLGFNSFSSIEYMTDVPYNPLGWAKDEILEVEILKALKASQEQDFVFAVSVAPHGKYPDAPIDENQSITMTGDLDESTLASYEYFINQLYETDAFIGSLIEELNKIPEPTVLIIYGDHLPSMNIEDIDLSNGNVFQTEYVIWNNMNLENQKRDLKAYQLYAHLFAQLNFNHGLLPKFHHKTENSDNYLEELHLLQYDMIYGDKTVFGGTTPYKPTSLKMGIDEIKITNIEAKGEVLLITGEHFTLWSEVYINGTKIDTLFVDSHTLICPTHILNPLDSVVIKQESTSSKILSESEEWIVP